MISYRRVVVEPLQVVSRTNTSHACYNSQHRIRKNKRRTTDPHTQTRHGAQDAPARAGGGRPDAVTGRGPGRAPSPLSYTTYQLSIVQCTGYAYGRVGHDQSVLHGYPLALITHREQVANRNLSHMSRQKQVPCPRRDSYSSNRRPLRDSLFGIGLAMQKGKLICVSGWFVCHLYGA